MQEVLWLIMRAINVVISMIASLTSDRGVLFWTLTLISVALFFGVTVSYYL